MSFPTPAKPLHPQLKLTTIRQSILHLLLSRPTSPPFNLANISTFMSSASGLDKSLMVIQYPAKIAVALLVALAAKLARSSGSRKTVGEKGWLVGTDVLMVGAVRYAARLKALSSSIGDARTMMRLLGIIPVLASIPSLLSSSSTTDATNHLINILQTVPLILYYPLENLSYLSSKGVFPLSPSRELNWSTWSCRFWAAYVVLDVWRLARRKKELQVKAQALRLQAASGEKAQIAEQVKALQTEKIGWLEEVVINVYVAFAYSTPGTVHSLTLVPGGTFSGYAPLTIHWSLPNGAWSNEAWTGVFGTIACLAGIRAKWRNMASTSQNM
ncbi:hypothetical protein QFC21_005267 [Naganishia friedmannii]|uniref:Uncharacterized protein n=1 Tax=Naganishia friedmannii TaxID=89922 RepID=A0ACC2VAR7_9TREE|nr:hypothetical protein QFC21_005267 [Naganishia friedmannii]